MFKKIILLLVSAVFLVGCAGIQRRELMQEYPSYSTDVQHAINGGYLVKGMTKDQVTLALGPTICKKTGTYTGKPVEVWSYLTDANPSTEAYVGTFDCMRANLEVYFEEGQVIGWEE